MDSVDATPRMGVGGGGVVMLTFPALAHMVQQMAGGDVQTLRMAQSILKFSNGFNATHGGGNALVQISWNR